MINKIIIIFLALFALNVNAKLSIPVSGEAGPRLRVSIPTNFFDYSNVKSCAEIKQINPNAESGHEVIFPMGIFGPGKKVFCDQETNGGGWTLVSSYNKHKDGCLTGFQIDNGNCLKTDRIETIEINTLGINYQDVRGNVVLKQFASTDGFNRLNAGSSVDDIYVDGASVTVSNAGVREHIHTYAIGAYQSVNGHPSVCPVNGGDSPPAFVGYNYTCESGNSGSSWSLVHYDNPLFSGNDFYKTISAPTTEQIELRVMNDQYLSDEGSSLESYYFYVR